MKPFQTYALGLLCLPLLAAQAPQGEVPAAVFRTTVVAKSTKAINYRHRSGSTHIDFAGTAIMPKAKGEAKVESRQGAISIDASFKDVGPASQFGAEYLTYVLGPSRPKAGRRTWARFYSTAARAASR